jgi:hypothetical protein
LGPNPATRALPPAAAAVVSSDTVEVEVEVFEGTLGMEALNSSFKLKVSPCCTSALEEVE